MAEFEWPCHFVSWVGRRLLCVMHELHALLHTTWSTVVALAPKVPQRVFTAISLHSEFLS